ncbi:GAF domain-containing protein [Nocardia sp. NPDC058633]|uniref:GAF domain-containing protein n=1 Tax=Nocardia sp. NPDC058633 TaxID=3346568 RepID=UPI00365EB48A
MDSSPGRWLLLETLTEDLGPSLVADDAQAKQWTASARLHRTIGLAPARGALDAVRRCVGGGESQRTVVGDTLLLAEPVRCAFGGVHGVQIWIGPADAPVRPRRRVAAWDFASDTELAHHGPGLEELVFAREPEQVRVVRTPPDAFGRMVRFDGRVDYFDMATRLEPGGHWQGEVDMLGDDDCVRRFQMVARARPDLHRVSALMHAIPELGDDAAALDPDVTMLRAVSQRSSVGVGFILLSSAVIYEWASEPPAPLDRWAVQRATIEPTDFAALRAACADAARRPGTARRLELRVRFDDGEWIRAQAELVTITTDATGHGLLRVWSAVDDESIDA